MLLINIFVQAAFRNLKRILPVLAIVGIYCSSGQKKQALTPEKVEPKTPYKSEFDRTKYSIQTGDTLSLTPENEDFSSDKIDEKQSAEKAPARDPLQKPKKSPAYYSGHKLMREVKYHHRVKKKGVVLSLVGAAKVRHAKTELRASKIEIIEANGGIVYIDRPLFIDDSMYNTHIRAGFGEYRKEEQTAYLAKNPTATHINDREKTKTTIKSDEMYRDFQSGFIHAKGNVEIIHSGGVNGYGKEAYYYEKEDVIILMGNPTIYEKKNVYKADIMKFYNARKLVIFEGNARVYYTRVEKIEHNNENADENREEGEVQTIVRGPRGFYKFGNNVELEREVVFYGKDEDPVLVFRPDMEGSCLKLTGRGDNMQELYAEGNVYILKLDDRTRFYAQRTEFRQVSDTLSVKTYYSETEDRTPPRVVFHNAEDKPVGILTAEKIDYNEKKNIVTVEGDVKFEFLGMGGEEGERPYLFGQWAQYNTREKRIEISGDPYIAQGDSRIFVRKIIISTDDKRVEFFGPVYGPIGGQ